MIKSIEVTGKTEEDAIESALLQLGLTRDDVSVEIIERSKSGFLGLGSTPAVVKVSYSAADDISERVELFLSGLLPRMGVSATPEIEKDDDRINVVLSGSDPGALIGRRGETLDAIQHLTNYVVNKGSSERVRVNIDAENYRSRRNETLESLAEKVASKVLKYKRSVTLDPMNAYERHVIHSALQNYENVNTYSVGMEPNRRVVVAFGKKREDSPERPDRARTDRPRPDRQRSDYQRADRPRTDRPRSEPLKTEIAPTENPEPAKPQDSKNYREWR